MKDLTLSEKSILINKGVSCGRGIRLHNIHQVNIYKCSIGNDVSIGAFVEIQEGVVIGSDCKISSHTFICTGVVINNGVFIGHNVSFINDKYPKATNKRGLLKTKYDWEVSATLVKKGASIGSGSTIMCGLYIGENAIIGAGSVVLDNVPDREIWAGNPAKPIG